METVTLDINQLKEIIENTVRKTMKEESRKIIEAILPFASEEEMNEITKNYGNEPKYDNFDDMTDWVKGEN